MNEETPYKAGKPKKGARLDVIIVGVIVLIALLGFAGVKIYGMMTPAQTVQISGPDGTEVSLPLDQDTRYVVTTELGTNTVVITDATVHIEDADCKNQNCVNQGTIDTPGQTLICLPHELVVRIVSTEETDGLDSVSQ